MNPLLKIWLSFHRAGFQFAFHTEIFFVIHVEAIVVAIATPILLLFLTSAIVGKDAEIMVGKLQKIFRIHSIALSLSVARQILVLFKQLSSVAAGTAVNAVTLITAPAISLRARIIPTATAAGLTIIDQRLVLASITSQKSAASDVDAFSPMAPAPRHANADPFVRQSRRTSASS
ncbi:hypothetical protein HNQ99_000922 [Rhizorhapis suberifaciens]|uniref:Uncharacterized protein n=1 Tax=Rhizorhapis suberifaciens TaxID=13656 RepID=A0A840HSP4_9SPHN|nr:hypothetical protein [Rhizorhapis suberifaciens]